MVCAEIHCDSLTDAQTSNKTRLSDRSPPAGYTHAWTSYTSGSVLDDPLHLG